MFTAPTHVFGVSLFLAAALESTTAQVVAQEPPREGQGAVSGRGPEQPPASAPPAQEPHWIPIVDTRLRLDHEPKPALERWLATVDINCVVCGGIGDPGALPRSANPNAPWALQTTVRHTSFLGTFSTGLLGVRNYASPLYSAMAIGGDFSPGAASTTTANFLVPSTQWHLTAAFERTVFTTAHGATLGLAADLLLPVKTDPVTGDQLRIDPLPSRAVRFGIVFRW